MQHSITPETNLTLNEVKKHFDQWRLSCQKRGKIPDSLWRKVKALTGRYSLTKITQD
ncbi:hypothetical protein [Aquicella lusitana]|uniref:Uncharacterized protein n=1 Tax=Aquicella lusitana TaxID=254246 RepID=A0A370G273_9COXI|nr:hypothetical protein [Aquicella lusitana]RDI37967.1 hypothetical protein C8D86_1366 [Aquicella lusitana]VVC74602.1 hypothetical protein AQULUS_23680 [Aquicella lusitana]